MYNFVSANNCNCHYKLLTICLATTAVEPGAVFPSAVGRPAIAGIMKSWSLWRWGQITRKLVRELDDKRNSLGPGVSDLEIVVVVEKESIATLNTEIEALDDGIRVLDKEVEEANETHKLILRLEDCCLRIKDLEKDASDFQIAIKDENDSIATLKTVPWTKKSRRPPRHERRNMRILQCPVHLFELKTAKIVQWRCEV